MGMDEYSLLERAFDLNLDDSELEHLVRTHPDSETGIRAARKEAKLGALQQKQLRRVGYFTVQEAVRLAEGRGGAAIRHLARTGRLGKVIREGDWPHEMLIPIEALASYFVANPYRPSGPKGPTGPRKKR